MSGGGNCPPCPSAMYGLGHQQWERENIDQLISETSDLSDGDKRRGNESSDKEMVCFYKKFVILSFLIARPGLNF